MRKYIEPTFPMEELGIISYIGQYKVNLYCPIVINNHIFCEGVLDKAYCDKQIEMLPNMKDESIIDIGCNTGYYLFELSRKGNSEYAGIDIDNATLVVAQKVLLEDDELEKKSIKLYCADIEFFNLDKKFDNVLCLNAFIYEDALTVMPRLFSLAKKRIIIEIANHPWCYKTKKEIIEFAHKELSKYGQINILGFADYQNRGMIEIKIKS